uniref:Uncharacterized protein n=1 Tax=Tetranychus urticae TaxID=32264 RepID=T1L4A7_TETUR
MVHFYLGIIELIKNKDIYGKLWLLNVVNVILRKVFQFKTSKRNRRPQNHQLLKWSSSSISE